VIVAMQPPENTQWNDLGAEFNAVELTIKFVTSLTDLFRLTRLYECSGTLLDDKALRVGQTERVVRELRKERPDLTLFVFGAIDLENRLRLFEAGMDAYFLEPFCGREVAALMTKRIRLRQAAAARSARALEVAELRIDLITRRAFRGDRELTLRPKEFQLLEFLMRNSDIPLSREVILDQVWGISFVGQTNVVSVYMSQLRKKIDSGCSHKFVQTSYGNGYVLRTPPAVAIREYTEKRPGG
jgi:two-component system, OmpR family, copper resistance phosphate regulon response regulator CusR